MAILDKKFEFSDAQSLAGVARATVASTNVINLGTGYNCWGDTEYNNIGSGGDLWLNVRVATAFAPIDTGTVISLLTASSAATAASQSGTTVMQFTVLNSTTMVAGTTLVKAKVPAGYSNGSTFTPLAQYLALWFTNNTVTMTAGAVDAWIGMDTESEVPRS